MKAEDTVIKIHWMNKDVQREVETLLLNQAEISFKAGIKEVVDWIEEKGTTAPSGMLYVFLGTDWEAELKEWGV